MYGYPGFGSVKVAYFNKVHSVHASPFDIKTVSSLLRAALPRRSTDCSPS